MLLWQIWLLSLRFWEQSYNLSWLVFVSILILSLCVFCIKKSGYLLIFLFFISDTKVFYWNENRLYFRRMFLYLGCNFHGLYYTCDALHQLNIWLTTNYKQWAYIVFTPILHIIPINIHSNRAFSMFLFISFFNLYNHWFTLVYLMCVSYTCLYFLLMFCIFYVRSSWKGACFFICHACFRHEVFVCLYYGLCFYLPCFSWGVCWTWSCCRFWFFMVIVMCFFAWRHPFNKKKG